MIIKSQVLHHPMLSHYNIIIFDDLVIATMKQDILANIQQLLVMHRWNMRSMRFFN